MALLSKVDYIFQLVHIAVFHTDIFYIRIWMVPVVDSTKNSIYQSIKDRRHRLGIFCFKITLKQYNKRRYPYSASAVPRTTPAYSRSTAV